MTPAKPISLIKTADFLDQKAPILSRLSTKELTELHAAPTNYPRRDDETTGSQSLTSNKLSHQSRDGKTLNSLRKMREKSQESKFEHESSASKGRSILKHPNALTTRHSVPSQKDEETLHFYEEKNEDEDLDSDSKKEEMSLNLAHLPSPSSLVGGITNLLSHAQSLFQSDSSTHLLDAEQSLSSISGSRNELAMERQAARVHDARVDNSFKETQQDHVHETKNKMGENESEGNNSAMQPLVTQAELAAVTGSAASSHATLSESVAATLRVTHLLDELMAAVSRLRLEGQDGKAMTIQLKNETLADTNVRLVSTAKQLEVSFLTSNPNSHLLLNENKNLLMLQNRLNALCSGQVVAVQAQLTPSFGSSHLGSEQDHSQDDLASFDQGNRGNFSNDEDTL